MIASVIIWFLGYYPNHNQYETTAEQQENSYIGQIGKAIEPVIEPLGFDWKMGIGLLSGVGAKELVVSTLGVLYTNEEDIENVNLSERIPITPLVAYGYMLFVLIYFPCIATIAAIKNESGSWKWAAFAACYTTALAWVVSFLTYQIGNCLSNKLSHGHTNYPCLYHRAALRCLRRAALPEVLQEEETGLRLRMFRMRRMPERETRQDASVNLR